MYKRISLCSGGWPLLGRSFLAAVSFPLGVAMGWLPCQRRPRHACLPRAGALWRRAGLFSCLSWCPPEAWPAPTRGGRWPPLGMPAPGPGRQSALPRHPVLQRALSHAAPQVLECPICARPVCAAPMCADVLCLGQRSLLRCCLLLAFSPPRCAALVWQPCQCRRQLCQHCPCHVCPPRARALR